MTEQDILEGNPLIHEFLGRKFTAISGYDGNSCVVNDKEFDTLLECSEWCNNTKPSHKGPFVPKVRSYDYEMRYHSSWDWLMPVVEKIESIVEKGYRLCRVEIFTTRCAIYFSDNLYYSADTDIYTGNCDTKIEAVYKAVLAFITWYNQQPK